MRFAILHLNCFDSPADIILSGWQNVVKMYVSNNMGTIYLCQYQMFISLFFASVFLDHPWWKVVKRSRASGLCLLTKLEDAIDPLKIRWGRVSVCNMASCLLLHLTSDIFGFAVRTFYSPSSLDRQLIEGNEESGYEFGECRHLWV